MRTALTAAVWIVSIGSLTVAALIVAALIFMASSLDPADIVTAGAEPWTDALTATLVFVGLVVATILALTLWHSNRFRIVGAIIVVGQVGFVGWAVAKMYYDYF